MVKLLIGNASIKVENANRFEQNAIRQACSYEAPGAKYTAAYRNGFWDGRKSVYDGRSKLFPAGLLYQVANTLKYNQIEFIIEDMRTKPEADNVIPHTITLRDYQKDAVERAIEVGRGTIQAPTGSGKTVIAIALACKLGVNTIIFTNRSDMVSQLKEEVERWTGIKCGVIQGRKRELRRITVATIQTLVAQIDRMDDIVKFFGALIIDEYHHSTSNSYLKVMRKMVNTYHRFGFTATPFRNDDASKVLAGVSGRVIHEVDKKELEEKGYLVSAKIRMIDITGYIDGNSFEEIYRDGIVNNVERNDRIVNEAKELLKQGERVLILVSRVRHGEILQSMTGWDFIKGESSKQVRDDARESMRIGDLEVLISTGIFDEGIDIPAISAIIFAGAGKSRVSVVQRVGRSLRPFKGKDYAIIIDFMDKQSPMLEAQSHARMIIYNRNGWDVETEISNYFS